VAQHFDTLAADISTAVAAVAENTAKIAKALPRGTLTSQTEDRLAKADNTAPLKDQAAAILAAFAANEKAMLHALENWPVEGDVSVEALAAADDTAHLQEAVTSSAALLAVAQAAAGANEETYDARPATYDAVRTAMRETGDAIEWKRTQLKASMRNTAAHATEKAVDAVGAKLAEDAAELAAALGASPDGEASAAAKNNRELQELVAQVAAAQRAIVARVEAC
jgi:hypothetical protein